MGFLTKLLGGSWESLIERARSLESQGDLGDALIEYEKALATKRQGVEEGVVREVEARAVALRDRIATLHIEQADALRDDGSVESAAEEYRTALQVAGTQQMEQRAQERLDGLEAALVRGLMEESREPTEQETFQALSGGWDEEQFDEYELYGQPFRKAFLLYHRGRPEEAVVLYADLLEKAGEDAVFLLYEMGRAHAAAAAAAAQDLADEQKVRTHQQEAVDCLERFLERLPGTWASPLRAAAWNELAQIHLERESAEDAEDALMNAQEAVPEEPLAYMNLGRFLMGEKRYEDAVSALEEGVEVMDKLRPNFRLLADLGLAYRQNRQDDEAISTLRSAVDGMVQMGHGYYDPNITVPLAELLENKGRHQQACDLYRHLCEGPDVENLALYHHHSARLLLEMGESELARSYHARSQELVGDDEDLARRIEELAGQL